MPPLKQTKHKQTNRQTIRTVSEALHKNSKINLRNWTPKSG